LAFNGDHIDTNLVKILISRLTSLEKLHNDKLLGVNNGVMLCKINKNTKKKNKNKNKKNKKKKKNFTFRDHVLWFPKGLKMHIRKFTKKWFAL
jgi:hypothetical protein